MYGVEKERALLEAVRNDSRSAFSQLFKHYYPDLMQFCSNFLKDKDSCEDVVQSVFVRLWMNRKTLVIETSLKSYLLRAVHNSCKDRFRHLDIAVKYEDEIRKVSVLDVYDTDNYILYSDLSGKLDEALSQLPEPLRSSFTMNRFQGLKYKEIAEILGVSQATVEVRISKSLKMLRTLLKDFLPCIILLIFKNL